MAATWLRSPTARTVAAGTLASEMTSEVVTKAEHRDALQSCLANRRVQVELRQSGPGSKVSVKPGPAHSVLFDTWN